MDGELHPHLRLLDPHKDLLPAADLIDLCFGLQIDYDGREYLRIVREAANNPLRLRWLRACNETVSSPMFGYVWEQDGRLVGNVSLIPFNTHPGWIYLIANVAVHPDYRGRGIARQLTQRALRHIREHDVDAAWLQVRADVPDAHHIYTSLGFQERARRNHWVSTIQIPDDYPPLPDGIKIGKRRNGDWPHHHLWLQQAYPQVIAWNQPLPLERMRPSLMRWLADWFIEKPMAHWAARQKHQLLGLLSWEPARFYDQLFLAPGEIRRTETITALLQDAHRHLDPLRPLSLSFPSGDSEEAFYRAGFVLDHTLIWMEINFAARLDLPHGQ